MRIDPSAIADFYARSTLGAPDRAIGFVLWRVMHRYQRAVDRALAPHHLTHLQFTTLAMTGWLSRTGEPVVQAELARRSEIHPMQISLMLKALEAKGLVARPRSASDTRTKQVEVTSAGLESLRRTMPIVITIQQRIFGETGAPNGILLTELNNIEKRVD